MPSPPDNLDTGQLAKPVSNYEQETIPPPALSQTPVSDYEQETMPPQFGELADHETAHPRSIPPSPGRQALALQAMGQRPSVVAPAVPVRPASSHSRQKNGLTPGQIIGDQYQLIRELGHGGMGQVFLARDLRLGRLVAIKFVIFKITPRSRELFLAEARATARCTHPNIVVIHSVDEHQGMPYMVLEFLEGKTFGQLMDSVRARSVDSSGEAQPPMSPTRAIELMLPVLHALERAHEANIVHRDLKPANIMLTNSGLVKVLDFGVAGRVRELEDAPQDTANTIHAGSDPEPTGAPGMVGTMPYMSPEQLSESEYDHRVDIWAVGITLFEMVTGKHPMAPLSMSKFQQIARLDTPMPRVHDIRPQVGKIGHVIDRCLIKHRDDRIASTRQLIDELEPLLPGHGRLNLAEDQSPFAGLAAFQKTDADRFFGRDDDIAAVASRVRNHPLVAVVGPSGTGKSSLIRAGVIPALERSGEGWESLIIRPGHAPIAALFNLLEQLTERTSTYQRRTGQVAIRRPDPGGGSQSPDADEPMDRDALLAHLREEPGYVGAELRAFAQRKLRRVLVFVDQFEELFTLQASIDEQRTFLACLAAIADDVSSPLRVALCMRADFLEHLAQFREYQAISTHGLTLLKPMDRAALCQALTRPVEAAGYRFESPDIVEHMLDALADVRGALPLLQFAATTLWKHRDRERRLLTRASYDNMGGVSGTLAQHADSVLASMSTSRRDLVRAIFQLLVTPERTRALVSISQLVDLPASSSEIMAVLDHLAAVRLVVADTGDIGGGMVEIVHESLIESWPTLRAWLDEDQDDAEFLARLRAAAQEWHKSGQSEGLLWRADVADDARHWRRHYKGMLAGLEQRYLTAVFKLSERTARRKRNFIIAAVAIWSTLILAAALVYVQLRGKDQTIDQQVLQIRDKNELLDQRLQETRDALTVAEEARQNAEEAERATTKALGETRRAYQRVEAAVKSETAAKAEAQDKAIAEAKARQEAERAREQAETARQESERARERAEESEGAAKQARDNEKAARVRLQKLLDQEKARTERLKQKLRGKMIPSTDNE